MSCWRLPISDDETVPVAVAEAVAALPDREALPNEDEDEETVDEVAEECLELVSCVAVEDTCVDLGAGGSWCAVVFGGGGAADPPKFQEPVKTPALSDAKKSKSPREKSRPANGQPSHLFQMH